jgi:hypothetical protein
MKARHFLMLASLAVAAGLAFFGDKSATGLAEPVVRQPAIQPSLSEAPAGKRVIGSSTVIEAESQVAQRKDAAGILALQPRADLMDSANGGKGSDRLFSSKSWTPPPVIAKLDLLPQPPPTAPPLPFSYLGKQTVSGQTEVFLANGDKVIVAREQDVIQNNYRVESIRPPTLTLVYLPLNEIQQLSIGATN